MTDSYKVLGKLATSDNKRHILYTAPAGKTALVSNITVSNASGLVTKTFDLSVVDQASENMKETLFVAFAEGGRLITASDGVQWNYGYNPLGTDILATLVTSDGKIFQGGSSSYYHYISKDKGISWNSYSSQFINQWSISQKFYVEKTDYDEEDKYLAFVNHWDGEWSRVYSSSDLINWNLIADGPFYQTNLVAYGNNTVVVYDDDMGVLHYSTNGGYTWSIAYWDWMYPWQRHLIFKNGKFRGVFEGTGYGESTDGISWGVDYNVIPLSEGTYIASENVNGVDTVVAFSGQSYDQYAVYTDTDGWEQRYLPIYGWTDAWLTSGVTENGPVFTHPGDYDGGMYSTDGFTWHLYGTPINEWWFANSAEQAGVSLPKNKIYSNVEVPRNDFVVLEPGIVCEPNSAIIVKGSQDLIFSVHGVEI